MSSKLVHAVYDDDDTLLHAVKDVKKADYHIEEVLLHSLCTVLTMPWDWPALALRLLPLCMVF